jgi:hypothetical protein
VEVAPVGEAWSILRGNPQFNLWQDDGSHPSGQGTYLAAVFSMLPFFTKAPKD